MKKLVTILAIFSSLALMGGLVQSPAMGTAVAGLPELHNRCNTCTFTPASEFPLSPPNVTCTDTTLGSHTLTLHSLTVEEDCKFASNNDDESATGGGYEITPLSAVPCAFSPPVATEDEAVTGKVGESESDEPVGWQATTTLGTAGAQGICPFSLKVCVVCGDEED